MDSVKKQRRWARGFFRLWVVFSILWVTIVAAFSYDSFPTSKKPWFEIQFRGESFTKSELIASADRAKQEDNSLAEAQFLTLLTVLDRRIENAQKQAIQGGLMIGFLVPLSLLVFGSLVAWAIRGFLADATK